MQYGAPEGYHDDCVVALALVAWQLKRSPPPGTASNTVSDDIHRKFKALESISPDTRFAVIVLSERLLSPTPYKNAICKEKVDIAKCKVFTCVLRRTYLGLHHKAVLINAQEEEQLWKSGEWQGLIDYLKTK